MTRVCVKPSKINIINAFVVVSIASMLSNLFYFSMFREVHIYFLCGILSMLVGYIFPRFFASYNDSGSHYIVFNPRQPVIVFYKFISFAALLLTIILLYKYGMSEELSVFNNLRHAKTVEQSNFYGVGHLGIFALFMAVYYIVRNMAYKSIAYFIIALCTSLISAERTSLLYSFVVYFGAYIIVTKLSIVKVSICALTVLLALFFVIAWQTNKLYNNDDMFFLISYISYPLEAMDGINMANVLLPSASVFGVWGSLYDIIHDVDLAMPDDHGLFNVYSYIYKPIAVFGVYGFVGLMFLLGFFIYIVDFMSTKNISFLFLKLSLLFSAIMSFYDWTFGLTTHIYIFMISALALGRYRLF